MFIFRAVVAIPGKAVQLIDQDDIEGHGGGVADHHLELRPLIRAASHGTVRISMKDGHIVPAGIVFTNAELSFNGLLALAV